MSIVYANKNLSKEELIELERKKRKEYYDQYCQNNINRQKRWSSEDDQIIKNSTLSDKELSELLGRSVRAIQIRRYRLIGKKISKVGGKKYTEEELEILRREDLTISEKARLTNRSVSSIGNKLGKMRMKESIS